MTGAVQLSLAGKSSLFGCDYHVETNQADTELASMASAGNFNATSTPLSGLRNHNQDKS